MCEDSQVNMPVDEDALNVHLIGFDDHYINSVDVAKRILDGKEQMEVAFKRVLMPDVRKESPARAHVFASIKEFIVYVQLHGGPNSLGLVGWDREHWSLSLTLDETKSEGFETIMYRPTYHPLIVPWIGCEMTAQDFYEFVVANKSVIIKPTEDEVINAFRQVQIAKKMEVSAGTGQNCRNGITIETTIARDVQNRMVPLPDVITIECPLFIDGQAETHEVDLIVKEKSEKVYVKTLFPIRETQFKKFTEVMEVLKQALPEITIGAGAINTTDWRYQNGRR